MKKITGNLRRINALSRFILINGTAITLLMLAVSSVLTYVTRHGLTSFNPQLFKCAKVYPLLTLMVLSLSLTGALLIDVYDKRYHQKT